MDRFEKFLARAVRGAPGQCWEFPGVRPGRYGKVVEGKKFFDVHRLSYEYFVGPIPEGQLVRHSCDNPPCWNPDHLLLGRGVDNTLDMFRRKRTRVARLTDEQIAAARRMYAEAPRGPSGRIKHGFVTRMAREFGVSPAAICHVGAGRTWGWLE